MAVSVNISLNFTIFWVVIEEAACNIEDTADVSGDGHSADTDYGEG
jgi:hypothetical protein